MYFRGYGKHFLAKTAILDYLCELQTHQQRLLRKQRDGEKHRLYQK